MLALVTDEPPCKQAGLPCCHVTHVQPVSGHSMPCFGSARLNHHHLMRQEGWLQAEDSHMWDTWRHRTQGSAAAPTGGRGGSGPLPESGSGPLAIEKTVLNFLHVVALLQLEDQHVCH